MRKQTASVLVLLSSLVASTGCYQTKYHGGLTSLPTVEQNAELLVVDVLRDQGSIEQVFGEAFLDRVDDATTPLVEQTGLARRVVQQRDVGSASTSGAFLVRFELAEYENFNGPHSGRMITTGLCVLLVPCVFLGAVPAVRISVRARWEMRVYDIRGLAPTAVRDPNTGELVASFDVTTLTPLLRRSYDVSLTGGIAARDNRPRERGDANAQAAANEFAARLVAASLDDITRAIRSADASTMPQVPTTPVAPTPTPTLTY